MFDCTRLQGRCHGSKASSLMFALFCWGVLQITHFVFSFSGYLTILKYSLCVNIHIFSMDIFCYLRYRPMYYDHHNRLYGTCNTAQAQLRTVHLRKLWNKALKSHLKKALISSNATFEVIHENGLSAIGPEQCYLIFTYEMLFPT